MKRRDDNVDGIDDNSKQGRKKLTIFEKGRRELQERLEAKRMTHDAPERPDNIRLSDPPPGWSNDLILNDYPGSVRRRGHLSIGNKWYFEIEKAINPGSRCVTMARYSTEKSVVITIEPIGSGPWYCLTARPYNDRTGELRLEGSNDVRLVYDPDRPLSIETYFRIIPEGKGVFYLLHHSEKCLGVKADGSGFLLLGFVEVSELPKEKQVNYQLHMSPATYVEKSHIQREDFILFR